MSDEDTLGRLVGALDAAGIPYMLTGSFASSYHGPPRATQDIDIVIAPTSEQIRRLVGSLPASDYYVDLDTALEALRHEGQFNVIDMSTGWKVDLIVRKSRPFSRREFERREPVDFHGMRLFIVSAEDILIAKLEWAKLGESARQLEDAAGILRTRVRDLDLGYVTEWVQELGLEPQWRAAVRAAGIAD